jgi:L-ascorbate metabolism protein UlaG (beta-lactamase superfamily)
VKLAEAVKAAQELVAAKAVGYDVTPLYAELPEALRGLVEIGYDLANHPSIRILEPSLYRSPYHVVERQSIDLALDDGTERPFILSTPRLREPGHLRLDVPFAFAGLDDLLAARTSPRLLGELADALGVAGDDVDVLASLLTTEPVVPGDRQPAAGVRARYFGHACLLFQTPDVSVLTDPFISSNVDAGDRYTYADLPDRIDWCLVTHGHQDHIVLESLLQLRHRIGVVVVPRASSGSLQDPSLRLYLEHLGFPVQEVEDFDELPIPGGSITATPFLGEHADLHIRGKTTYVVRLGDRRFYVGADSSGVDRTLYRYVAEACGPVDLAFVGMECDGAPLTWLYQALITQPISKKMSDSRKLSGSNAEQALAIVEELGAGEAYVYAMGEEDWLGHVMATSYTPESYQLLQVAEFVRGCGERGVKAEHLFGQREWRW